MADEHPRVPDDTALLASEGVVTTDVVADVVGRAAAEELEPVAAALPPFATWNVLASFDDNAEARRCIEALEKASIESSHLSYLALESRERAAHEDGVLTNDERVDADTHAARQVGAGAAVGGGAGAIAGALAGAALMLIPGVGTVAGVGVLAGALGGAAAGGNLGLVWGGFRRIGVSPAWEHTFLDVEAGRAIVGVHTDDEDELRRARDILPADGCRFFDRDGHPTDAPTGA